MYTILIRTEYVDEVGQGVTVKHMIDDAVRNIPDTVGLITLLEALHAKGYTIRAVLNDMYPLSGLGRV
jgi:hypothetical protein